MTNTAIEQQISYATATASNPYSDDTLYRRRESQMLAGWIQAGESGVVVGLAGADKTEFLNMLCQQGIRPYWQHQLSPPILLSINLHSLPDKTPQTLYCILARAFYEGRSQFHEALQPGIQAIYQYALTLQDLYLIQSNLREMFILCRSQQAHVVLVLNHFDQLLNQPDTRAICDSLYALYQDFKGFLSFIFGMRQEIVRLARVEMIGPLYEVLDTLICWIGPLTKAEAKQKIKKQLAHVTHTEEDTNYLYQLTGGYPALIRTICHNWQINQLVPSKTDWESLLLKKLSIRRRLDDLWRSFTPAEQSLLLQLQRLRFRFRYSSDPEGRRQQILQNLEEEHPEIFNGLMVKGTCTLVDGNWQIKGELFANYIDEVSGRSRGAIWMDEETQEVYIGEQLVLELSPLERSVMKFFIENPRIRHTHTNLIEAAWPDDIYKEGVSTESLYQVIRGIRKKIEPNSAKPCYIINWRGQPEGGYQFFPDGKESK